MKARKNTEKTETKGKKNTRTAIIVGASSGIGRETALRLVARGDTVFNLSRTAAKPPVRTVTADASEEGALTRAVESICKETGGLDLLVYCAGYSCLAPVACARSEDYRYLFEVNYFGAVEALRAAAPFLEKRGGRAVLVGSMGGELPIPYDGFYCASKAALCMLARETDMEWRSRGVRVSALLPGGTATGFTDKRTVYSEEESEAYFLALRRSGAALANIEQGGMNPSLVADAVIRLAGRRNPPAVAAAGGKNIFVRAVARMMPERVTDWAVRRKFNQR